jgi:hypothetical protein
MDNEYEIDAFYKFNIFLNNYCSIEVDEEAILKEHNALKFNFLNIIY